MIIFRSFLSFGVSRGARTGAGERFNATAACRSLLAVSPPLGVRGFPSRAHSSSCPSSVSTPEDEERSGPGVGGQCKAGGASRALRGGAAWLTPFSGPGERSSAVEAEPMAESSSPGTALGLPLAGALDLFAASLTIQKILA